MPSPSVSTFTFPSTTEPVFTASTSEPVFESPNHTQTSQTTQSQQLQQYHTTTVSNNNAKFPYLKKEEYETWAMKMEGILVVLSKPDLEVSEDIGSNSIRMQLSPDNEDCNMNFSEHSTSWSQVSITLKTKGRKQLDTKQDHESVQDVEMVLVQVYVDEMAKLRRMLLVCYCNAAGECC
ncbi:hypothetical protein Tco_0693349 [Tanacetum coccineum]